MENTQIIDWTSGEAFKEYRTPKCSRCHVIVKADAEICPRCEARFLRDD